MNSFSSMGGRMTIKKGIEKAEVYFEVRLPRKIIMYSFL